MKISNTHQRFSEELNESRALTHPQEYLGLNWNAVINFWLYVDGLSEEEIDKIGKSYWALDYDVLKSAEDAAWDSSEEVVGWKVRSAAVQAAYSVSDRFIFYWVTIELIGLHKILEQDKSLIFLKALQQR
jgi:hypothetical protein